MMSVFFYKEKKDSNKIESSTTILLLPSINVFDSNKTYVLLKIRKEN